jgi:hypothetical protein
MQAQPLAPRRCTCGEECHRLGAACKVLDQQVDEAGADRKGAVGLGWKRACCQCRGVHACTGASAVAP